MKPQQSKNSIVRYSFKVATSGHLDPRLADQQLVVCQPVLQHQQHTNAEPPLPHSRLVEKSTVLNSWKEIAVYMDRGVRTVQRWEAELGLPIHRPRGKQHSAVLAFTEDVDDWLRRTPAGARETAKPDSGEVLNDLAHDVLEFAREVQALALRLELMAHQDQRREAAELARTGNEVVRRLALLVGDSHVPKPEAAGVTSVATSGARSLQHVGNAGAGT